MESQHTGTDATDQPTPCTLAGRLHGRTCEDLRMLAEPTITTLAPSILEVQQLPVTMTLRDNFIAVHFRMQGNARQISRGRRIHWAPARIEAVAVHNSFVA
jgi:hypothetical protein